MKCDVKVTVKSRQIIEDEGQDTLEIVTFGRYYQKNGKYFLMYQENTGPLAALTTTFIVIQSGHVTVRRTGEIQGVMDFIPGTRITGQYCSDNYNFVLTVYTDKLNIDVNDDGGQIFIGYDFELEGQVKSTNSMDITIQKGTFNL